MYTIEMLPASLGDCLWIEYGDARSPHRILIDGGTVGTIDAIRAKICSVAEREGRCRLELVVVTHIDADHIEGIIKLLGEPSLPLDVDDLWFNGQEHLPHQEAPNEGEFLNAVQGDFLSLLLRKRAQPWNSLPWKGKTVWVPKTGELPVHRLDGGMSLTLLSPTFAMLKKLSARWTEELTKAGLLNWKDDEILEKLLASRTLAPIDDFLGDYDEDSTDVRALVGAKENHDTSPANGSSIAFVASYGDKHCLFAGDAYSSVLCEGVRRMTAGRGGRLKLDAFKVPHHGSRGNIHDDLLALVDCHRFLVSTNGSRFKHPDAQAIARLVGGAWRGSPEDDAPVELNFNYRTEFNRPWDDAKLRDEWNYEVVFPPDGVCGLVVTLDPGPRSNSDPGNDSHEEPGGPRRGQ